MILNNKLLKFPKSVFQKPNIVFDIEILIVIISNLTKSFSIGKFFL